MSDARYPKQLDHWKGSPDIVEPKDEVQNVTIEIIEDDEAEESTGQGESNGK